MIIASLKDDASSLPGNSITACKFSAELTSRLQEPRTHAPLGFVHGENALGKAAVNQPLETALNSTLVEIIAALFFVFFFFKL